MKTVLVPILERDKKTKKKEEKIDASSIRVLMVDRDILFLPVAKEILQLFGDFEIDISFSLLEARKALEKKEYDVIVSNYFFDSGETALGLFKELKAKGNRLPFVLFSFNDEIANEALKVGVVKFISKKGDCEKVYADLSNTIKKLSRK